MIAFLDSSALTKRYLREAETEALLARIEGAPVAVSPLALTEVPSAIAQRWRDGVLPTATRDAALAAFDVDAPHFEVVEISPVVTQRSRELLLRHPLRTLDSLQLACCLELEFHSRLEIVLFCYAARLSAAAAAEGLAVESP